MQLAKKSGLAALGLIGACALCCALPLAGGAAALGLAAWFANPFVVGALAIGLAAAGVLLYVRRRASGSGASCATSGCRCGSCNG